MIVAQKCGQPFGLAAVLRNTYHLSNLTSLICNCCPALIYTCAPAVARLPACIGRLTFSGVAVAAK